MEQYDATAALEQVTASGLLKAKEDIFLSPLDDRLARLPELHHPCFVFKLQAAAFD